MLVLALIIDSIISFIKTVIFVIFYKWFVLAVFPTLPFIGMKEAFGLICFFSVMSGWPTFKYANDLEDMENVDARILLHNLIQRLAYAAFIFAFGLIAHWMM